MMNKQKLAAKIWAAANDMRGKIDANEYKDYILGFTFYKFLSQHEWEHVYKNFTFKDDNDEERRKNAIECLKDEENKKALQEDLGYYIPYEHLYNSWLKKGIDFSIKDVSDALSDFERNIDSSPKSQAAFGGILDTVRANLSKLGKNAGEQSKAMRELVTLIKDIPVDSRSYDTLGYIYEYLIDKFASGAGKKAGEFYTPHEPSLVMAEIVANHLKNSERISVYDPTSGSGALLLNIGSCFSKYNSEKYAVEYFAQEKNTSTYNITRMNLLMKGIAKESLNVRNADTLEEDWPVNKNTGKGLRVDAVVSNPPYSIHWNTSGKELDERYKAYGVAPQGKADYAFLLHDLYHVNENGIMTIVLPHGVLFRGGSEETIRKNLIDANKIDAIIGLPANIFYGTGIPTIIMVLKQHRENDDILFIDASNGFDKKGTKNTLRARDIKRIVDTIESRETITGYSKLVTKEEIKKSNYNLNIPRYVPSSIGEYEWDIFATMFGGVPIRDVDQLNRFWNVFPSMKKTLLRKNDNNEPYYKLTVDDVKATVNGNSDVVSFIEKYTKAFEGFDKYLYEQFIDNMNTVDTHTLIDKITDDAFNRLTDIPLVNEYAVYQILHSHISKTITDLELINQKGKDSINAVDPNMVTKKKNKETYEVQEGWVGRIIPFELVQSEMMKDKFDDLKDETETLNQIIAELAEIFDNLTDDQKTESFVGENGFKQKECGIIAKAKETDLETVEMLKTVIKLLKQKTAQTKVVNKLKKEIETSTKDVLENLTYEEQLRLLDAKWIQPVMKKLMEMPLLVVKEFIGEINIMAERYAETLTDIKNKQTEINKNLTGIVDNLEGDEYSLKGLTYMMHELYSEN